MTNETTLIISDIHLGCNPNSAVNDRENILCDFLTEQSKKVNRIILLGDVFEFWMEYKDYIPKQSFKFLSTLRNLTDQGIEIHYFAGNHDFQLGEFFTKHLGVICHQDGAILESGAKRIFFIHGDGLDPEDWKYRLAKKIIRSPINQFLFKLLHPDWGMNLARLVGRTSRDATGYDHTSYEGYQKEAKAILGREKVDAVVHGHLHQHELFEYENGQHVITGQWLMDLTYTLLNEGEFTLKTHKMD
jgi:UDP-2,3-diacylglucosamine hydrolase